MATAVHNGNDYDLFIFNPKVDSKWKPPDQGTAGAPVDYGIHGRIF